MHGQLLGHRVVVSVSIAVLVMTGCSMATSGTQQTASTFALTTQPTNQPPIASSSASPTGSAVTRPSGETNLDGAWTLHALVGTDGRSVLLAPASDKVKLTFAHGDMTGTTVCNSVWGSYVQGGAKDQNLSFANEKLGSTLVACADEPPLTSRLLDVRHVSGSPDVRYLHSENWMIVVELRRA